MITKSDLTAEGAKKSLGRYGKVNGAGSYYYGQIIDVHASGEYLLFLRGHRGIFKPKWYHRSDVFPYEDRPGGPGEVAG